MTVSANTSEASAPAQNSSAETAALIKTIAAEARASGRDLTFDPDAPSEPETQPTQPEPDSAETEPGAEETADAEQSEQPDAEPAETPAAPVELDFDAIKAALGADDFDLETLAKALGVTPEKLQLTPSQFKAARIERRKTQKTLERAHALQQKLESTYGDQVRARKSAADGDLQPAIDFVEATFGMTWNELNVMVADLLKGKPPKDLEQRRELRELKKREAEREASDKAKAEEATRNEHIASAKAWIASVIKADPLASTETHKQLEQAGLPTIVDLVFDELHAGYAKGLTDPTKALERVKGKLAKQARALQAAGVLPKAEAPKPRPLSASKPRANAQTGSAGHSRQMTDAELRRAVLKEAGLLR